TSDEEAQGESEDIMITSNLHCISPIPFKRSSGSYRGDPVFCCREKARRMDRGSFHKNEKPRGG
ncbi:hypothetical protein, partial [Hydrogenivirga sp. 128-5-R1-1]|uniref:hypothetical protein n=1 Tax=Hydrogenivirga sp. 128-5-R1-1 TaxID=392423 RepID=UPI001E329225